MESSWTLVTAHQLFVSVFASRLQVTDEANVVVILSHWVTRTTTITLAMQDVEIQELILQQVVQGFAVTQYISLPVSISQS